MNPSNPPGPEKLEVPTKGCGCAGEGAFGTWQGEQDRSRALAQTATGRLILWLRERLERLFRR